MFFGDLFDFDTAFGRADHRNSRLGAIENQSEVELTVNVQPLFDQHSPNLTAFWSRLMGDEISADHFTSFLFGLLRVARQLDAAGFAAPAGMDLGFNDTGAAAKPNCRRFGLFRRCGNFAPGNRNAVALENLFGLIFVNIHRLSPRQNETPGLSISPRASLSFDLQTTIKRPVRGPLLERYL